MLKQKSSEYRGFREPGIRMREPLSPQLAKLYGARIPILIPALHAFDKAHIVMLVEEKLLTPKVGAALLRGLRQMEGEGIVETRSKVGGGLHSGEQYLIRLLGEEVGGRMTAQEVDDCRSASFVGYRLHLHSGERFEQRCREMGRAAGAGYRVVELTRS